jgi:hypothetical protein
MGLAHTKSREGSRHLSSRARASCFFSRMYESDKHASRLSPSWLASPRDLAGSAMRTVVTPMPSPPNLPRSPFAECTLPGPHHGSADETMVDQSAMRNLARLVDVEVGAVVTEGDLALIVGTPKDDLVD